MKKAALKIFTIILILIVSITCTIGSYAESESRIELAKQTRNFAASMLEQLMEIYNKDKSGFSKEYIYMTYSYFNMWIAMDKAINAEECLSSSTSPISLWGLTIANEKQIHSMNKTVFSNFEAWLNDEMDDEEFCLYFMIYVDAVLQMNENRNQ